MKYFTVPPYPTLTRLHFTHPYRSTLPQAHFPDAERRNMSDSIRGSCELIQLNQLYFQKRFRHKGHVELLLVLNQRYKQAEWNFFLQVLQDRLGNE